MQLVLKGNMLSTGQTDLQVVESSRKLILRKVSLGGQTDSQAFSKVHTSRQRTHFKAEYPVIP